MARRADLLDFAVLGLLHEAPMHGYELRKRLNLALGAFRALSYGSLYPCLRDLLTKSWIAPAPAAPGPSGSRRARIVYQLTADGRDHFRAVAGTAGPSAWDDDEFDVHFAFFARTPDEVRLRILEGRRSRLEEQLATIRAASARGRERMDAYAAALQRHGEESAEREVRWLEELIVAERALPASETSPTSLTDRSATPTPPAYRPGGGTSHKE